MARNRWLAVSVVVSTLAACSGGGGGGNHTLTVTVTGSGSGAVTSSPPGISCTSGTCSASFPEGTLVTLTALGSGASTFGGWGVACGGTGGCTVAMGVDMSVTATFDAAQAAHILSVTVGGNGAGAVTSSPPGISCTSGTCSAAFPEGTQVTLTALASGASTFGGWGVACGGMGGCTVTMNVDMSVTATFNGPVHTLSVTVTGIGSGIVTSSPGGLVCSSGTCSTSFAGGTQVTLTASPTSGASTFGGWTDSCSGTGVCSVTMDADVSVTATFVPAVRVVSVTIAGNGSVTSSPSGISCSSGTCSATFLAGGPPQPWNTVTLVPTPDASSTFSGWSGACVGTGGCILPLDTDKSVTATFSGAAGQVVNVTVAGDGVGTVTSTPAGIDCMTGSSSGCSATFDPGTTVTLTGTAAPGSSFLGWSPMCDGSPDPCSFTISSTTNVTAKFPAWTVRRPFPNAIKGVAALGSTLIAVGTGGRVVTSPDGVAWTGHELPNTRNQLRSVTADAAGTAAVAVGDGGTILTTADADAWTSRTSPTTAMLSAVAHGGGAFVAVGAGGVIVSSENGGATWSTRTSNTVYDLLSVAYGSSRFVAVGYGGTVLTSSDGQSWTKLTPALTTQYLAGVAYDPSSGFVAVGNAGAVLTSSDGSAWTLQSSSIPVSGSTEVRGVAARSGTFVALDSEHDAIVSTTGGTSWTTYAVADDLSASGGEGICAAGGSFFAMSDAGISSSPDGVSWTRVLTLRANFYGMAYGASNYVLVGHGVIFSSPDGAVWTSRFAGNPYLRATDMVSSVVYANGMFVAVSGHGILASTDGASWTTVGPAPSQYGGVVAYGAGRGFVVASAGNPARIWTSPDGVTWTEQTEAAITTSIWGITWGPSTFVAVGGSSGPAIYTNATPASTPAWTPQSAPGSRAVGGVLYGNSLLVASDGQWSTFTSTNSVSWTENGVPYLGQLLTFGDGVFVTQNLNTSSDGVAWTPMAFPPPGMSYVYAGTYGGPAGWVLATGTGGMGGDAGTYVFGVHP